MRIVLCYPVEPRHIAQIQAVAPHAEIVDAGQERVAAELKTTFASHYTTTISLQEALQLDNIAAYAKRATGEKFLINPNKG